MKRFSYLHYVKLLIMLIAMPALIISCSDSDNDNGGGLDVSSYFPVDVAPTALHEKITVQFNRVGSVGAANTDACFPYYDVKIGTDDKVDNAYDIGEVESNDSLLVRFDIKKAQSEEDGTDGFPVLYYDELKDNTKYTIWLRSNYSKCGYGVSDWTYVNATPIPLPTKLEDVKVEQGDKHLRISWTKKDGELYTVHVDDCPQRPPQYSKWTPALSLNSDHYIVSLEDNEILYDGSAHSICIASHNANGILDAEGESTFQVFGIDIYKEEAEKAQLQGKASVSEPEKPVIKGNPQGKNKRVEFDFGAVAVGGSAVSEYEAGYSTDGTNYKGWRKVDFTQDDVRAVVPDLENGEEYYIQLRAKNSFNDTWVESDPIKATPEYSPVDLSNPDQYLGTAAGEFIYAENVPHSDFWRISENFHAGGRPNTDRLVRGKETALGNLFADAIKWYGEEMTNENLSFAWLIGDMISQGIPNNQVITPKFLQTIISSDYLDDTLVVVELKGSDLIGDVDYNLDLENYPAVGSDDNQYTRTLLGQAASVYRNNHYGGSGGTTYNGKWWGMPSREVRYAIEYLPYSIDNFNSNFNTKCSTVNKSTGIDSETGKLYDAVTDPKGCYLLTYEEANPQSGNPTENSVMGYKRGRIQSGSLTVNGAAVDPNETYRIITTTKTAKEMYTSFLGKNITDIADNGQKVTMLKAVAEYISYKNNISPYLDGRVKLIGGVPGDTKNDFKN